MPNVTRFIVTLVALVLATPAAAGDPCAPSELCAWVALDGRGDVWVDGHPGSLSDVENRSCAAEGGCIVLATEYCTPAGAIAEAVARLEPFVPGLRYFTHGDRERMIGLFGLDVLERCEHVGSYSPSCETTADAIVFRPGNTPWTRPRTGPLVVSITGSGSEVELRARCSHSPWTGSLRRIAEAESRLEDAIVARIECEPEVPFGVAEALQQAVTHKLNRLPIVVELDGKPVTIRRGPDGRFIPAPPRVQRRVVGEPPPSDPEPSGYPCPYGELVTGKRREVAE